MAATIQGVSNGTPGLTMIAEICANLSSGNLVKKTAASGNSARNSANASGALRVSNTEKLR